MVADQGLSLSDDSVFLMRARLTSLLLEAGSSSDYLSSLEPYAFLVPIVVLVGAGIVFKTALLQAALSGGSASRESRINCPSCGARTAVGGTCDYCDEPLPGGSRPESDH